MGGCCRFQPHLLYFSATFFLLGPVQHTLMVRINRLVVPEVAPHGVPILLDCDYTLEEAAEEGLVVKWFFNEKPTPVYQWIPNKKPQELGILKGRLDLKYNASKDRNSVHRALHILKPGPDLTGNYTCLVSTFASEDERTKRMLIFVPEKRLDLRQEYIGGGVVKLLCSTEGVFPEPRMTLHIGSSEGQPVNHTSIVVSVKEKAGLYDISATTFVAVQPLQNPEESDIITCELRIPQANYTVRKEAIYYPTANKGCKQVVNSTLRVIVLLVVSTVGHQSMINHFWFL